MEELAEEGASVKKAEKPGDDGGLHAAKRAGRDEGTCPLDLAVQRSQ